MNSYIIYKICQYVNSQPIRVLKKHLQEKLLKSEQNKIWLIADAYQTKNKSKMFPLASEFFYVKV